MEGEVLRSLYIFHKETGFSIIGNISNKNIAIDCCKMIDSIPGHSFDGMNEENNRQRMREFKDKFISYFQEIYQYSQKSGSYPNTPNWHNKESKNGQ